MSECAADTPIALSIVAPAHNEEDNVARLVEEVGHAGQAVCQAIGADASFEFILVDDGSTDGTRSTALTLMAGRPWLRLIAMGDTPSNKGNGQSAAFTAGFRAVRGELVAVLDIDSREPAAFDASDREGLEAIVGILSPHLDSPKRT